MVNHVETIVTIAKCVTQSPSLVCSTAPPFSSVSSSTRGCPLAHGVVVAVEILFRSSLDSKWCAVDIAV